MSGELILGAVVIVGVIIAGRMLSPVDHNINRVYLRRMLRACGELDPKENIRSLRAARIPIAATEEQNMERVYHRLSITTNRGRKLSYVAQSFYPLAILFEQREQKRQPAIKTQAQAETNPYHMTPTYAGIEYPEYAKEDPIKDEVEEAEVKNRKIQRLQAEIAQLSRLNQYTNIFPTLLSFDDKRLFTIVTGAGTERLDFVLADLDLVQRQRILAQVIEQLADAHASTRHMMDQLLPGMQHNETLLLQLLEMGISMWNNMGIQVTGEDMQQLLLTLQPIVSYLQESEQGLKLGEATPRNFYWNGKQAVQLDWGRARLDYCYFDLAELLCDPVSNLTAASEEELVQLYLDRRGLPLSVRKDIYYAFTIYRIILVGYMCQYVSRSSEMSEMQRQSLGGIHWDKEHVQSTWSRLVEQTGTCSELADLHEILLRIGMQQAIP